MKIDFSQKILNLSGKGMPREDKTDSMLSDFCVNALLATLPGEENLSKIDKLKRGKLAEKVYEQGEVDITVEEAALLQTLIGKAYGPLIVMRTDAMLEGNKKE